LVQNGVHSLPKSHLMHDEVGDDGSQLGEVLQPPTR
jgi:hypothetical protein